MKFGLYWFYIRLKKMIYYIDTTWDISNITEQMRLKLEVIAGILNNTFILHGLIDDNSLFQCNIYHSIYIEPITQLADTSIYVFFTAYFIRKCCPV